MFSTPFCQHQFSEEQLNTLEWVVCPCGYHYRSANLKAYATKFAAYNKARTDVELLITEITADNAYRQAQREPVAASAASAAASTYVPTQITAAPRPQRSRATVSVSQWLIISASILVLIAASVFVQSNIDTWQAPQWLILESVLGVAAVAGTIFGRKLSVLLANFLAVFSAGMLMSLIMTIGTQLNLGFITFDSEPAWYWAINLAIVSIATSAASLKLKNFGWRALSPVALTISGLLFTYGAVGEAISAQRSAFAWQLIALSFTVVALLIQLKYLRAIKQEVDPKSENREYEEDLHKREDDALQRFGTFATILLAVVGLGFTLVQVLTTLVSTPFEPIATLTLGALWLLGSSTIDFWGTSLSRTGVVPKAVKTGTWTLAYMSIGFGLNSLMAGKGVWLSLGVGLAITLVLATLPRYARFVKPPMVTLTATSLGILVSWAKWNLDFESINILGVYLFGFAVVTVAADYITKSKINNLTALLSSSASAVILALSWFSLVPNEMFELSAAAGLAAVLLVANFSALTSGLLAERTKTYKPDYIATTTLMVGMLGALVFGTYSVHLGGVHFNAILGEMIVLLLWVTGAQTLNYRNPATTRELQSLIGAGIAGWVALQTLVTSNQNLYIGFVLLGFGVVAYVFGYLEQEATKLQLGLGATFVALFVALGLRTDYALGTHTEVLRFALLFSLVPALVAAHNWLIQRRTGVSLTANVVTNSLVVLVGAALAPLSTVLTLMDGSTNFVWAYLAGGVLAFALHELPRVAANKANAFQLRAIGFGYFVFGLTVVWQNIARESTDTNNLRTLVFFGVIALAGLRLLSTAKDAIWAVASYTGSIGVASVGGSWISQATNNTWHGPEIFSLLIAGVVTLNGALVSKTLGKKLTFLTLDIPFTAAVLPTFVFAFNDRTIGTESTLRLLVVGALVAGYSYWRAKSSKQASAIGWIIGGYIGSSIALCMAMREVGLTWLSQYNIHDIEYFSISILAATFFAISQLKKVVELKGTLITWGLPLGVILVPSALASYQAITTPFEQLQAVDVTRVIAVIVLSAAALVFGMRQGNLGAASAGTVALTLTAIPNLWFRFDGVAAGNTTVELRALLVGGFVFMILAVSKKFAIARGNSAVFIGIPTTIALAPAVLNTLNALQHPTFQAIDWWRFAIVLSISLTLLVVGSLRELAGMFYPGFAGVLVSALPYGFNTIHGAAWLLWIILLLVAGTLIWLAMRIEKMRKQGRTPAMWLKQLH